MKVRVSIMRLCIVTALLILSDVEILMAMDIKSMTGERVELKCTTNLQYPVVWHFRKDGGTQEIFLGGEISMSFKEMFSLTGNESLGEYNLLISSADGRYVGNYKCIDDDGMGSELLSIQLNIIALTSSTYIPTSTLLAPVAANHEAPKAVASSSQDDLNTNSNNNAAIIGGVVVSAVVIIIVSIIIIVVLLRKRYTKLNERSSKNSEAQVPSDTESPVMQPCLTGSSDTSQKNGDSDLNENPDLGQLHTVQAEPIRPRIKSDSSTNSTTPLLIESTIEHL